MLHYLTMLISLRVGCTWGLFGVASLVGMFGAASCGSGETPKEGNGAAAGQSGGGNQPDGGSGGQKNGAVTAFQDFPRDPVFDGGAKAEAAKSFAANTAAAAGADPCLTEPAPDAMVPKNWSPLLFEWASAATNLFELRLHVKGQENDLVVYTDKTSYTLPAATWTALTTHSAGEDIQLTLRGVKREGGVVKGAPAKGAEAIIHLAPVEAPGSVVYWADSPTQETSFKGFTVGDTTAKNVLTPSQVGEGTYCISCHTSSAGGDYFLFTRDVPNPSGPQNVGIRAVKALALSRPNAPAAPGKVSPSAAALLAREGQSAPVTSSSFGSIVLTGFDAKFTPSLKPELSWTNLQAADGNLTLGKWWGILARNGDPGSPGSASWSHSGKTVYYTSSPVVSAGIINVISLDPAATTGAFMDIYSVPYANGQGGTATPVPGASDESYLEYYPAVSPDDNLLVFNRTPKEKKANGNWRSSYHDEKAEVMAMPLAGGAPPVTLKANQPSACAVAMKPDLKSPGITNSYPKWAPSAGTANGKKYYWIVFSSKRQLDPAKRHAQLYLAAVVTKVAGNTETIEADYPAVYLSAQGRDDSNFIPVWDNFALSAK